MLTLSTRRPDSHETIVGNVYHKYTTRNPIASRLMKGFLRTVEAMYVGAGASTVLEVGCGEGHLARHLLRCGPTPVRFEACDLSLDKVAADADSAIRFRVASAYQLPYAYREFDLVICCEVLEHLHEPARALSELRRVAREAVLLSTPREPLWRFLNVCRGRYLASFGDTPGHVQHFSRRDLLRLVRPHFHIRQVQTPTPWTVVLGEPKQ